MISLLFFYSVFLVRKLYKIKVSFKEITHNIIRLVQKTTNIAIIYITLSLLGELL